ncbi:LamG-like jellyroll fold domain-containing protein [Streptomyces sp. NBC_00390]|uniref:LamG-like jellyroll fold domain-containing protein n=1 Tax=Streptomyces sp. NBC_00390 TaxID=2975736 RepID=UPI003FCDC868
MWSRRRGVGRFAGVTLGAVLAVGLLPSPDGQAAPQPTVQAANASSQAPDGDKVLTEAEALAEAKRTGTAVEVMGLRGESREVFATPEGELEAREYLRPVWTRGAGAWKRVDTSLAVTDRGVVAPKATTAEVAFSGGGDSAPLVSMEKAGRVMSLSWPDTLPAPELDGAVATYKSVLPDVDLRMTAQEDGFTQLLVVKTAEAANNPALAELRLQLATDGLDVRTTDEGGLEAVDQGAQGTVFEAPKPFMWDSSAGGGEVSLKAGRMAAAAASDGEPGAGESGKLAPVGAEVSADGDELVLTPDTDVLKGSGTTYPVFIDPQWYSERATAWTMASKYWAGSPQWKFNGDSDAGLGYCNWSYCAPHDTKRLFYQIPVSRYAGKSILSAEFVVRNTWSASCSDRTVELWETKPISSSTTWNSQNAAGFWVKELASKSFAYGFTGCGARDAEFDVKAAVQAAANDRDDAMTFGLRAASESDGYAWKRFSDKAFLRVTYNRPPPQIKMSQLSMQFGGVCKKPQDAVRTRSLGTISANDIVDPDGDSIAVQFQAAWDSGDGQGMVARWKPDRTISKPSGSDFTVSLPSSIPENKQVSWYVRSYDGAQSSPWSNAGAATGCYFYYDTQAPKSPSISSGEYPASNSEDPNDPWYDGMGKYGTFEIKANDSQVTKYWYGLNVDPTAKNEILTTGGAAKTIPLLPAKIGLNTLYVSSLDAAGNKSAPTGYRFRVKAGQPERAGWALDEAAGATEATGTVPAQTAELFGGPTPGTEGAIGTAIAFDGVDDYARTDIPTVATDTGFSVSAWAKLSKMPDGAAIIAAQPGNHSPGFELYYSKTYDRWVFNQYAADTAGSSIVRAMAPQPGGVQANVWTHLMGTYSSSTGALKLYVDGTLVGTTTHTTPWDARRGLQIGAGSYSGTPGSFFPGAVDEVRIFDKPVSDADVAKLHAKQPIGAGRPARAVFPMDEAANATQITGRADVHAAVLKGGAKPGEPGVTKAALTLDGVDDYATTGSPQVNNQRGFSVAAWAKLSATKPNHGAVIATQAGVHKSGFELYYSSAYDRWVFNQYSADTPEATPIRAMQPDGTTARAGEWVHLAGVHDTVANRLTLYVNGVEAGTATVPQTWYASGAVQIGAGSFDGAPSSFFPGQIDDVKLFDRPVSAGEVQQLFKQRPLVKARWKFEEITDTVPSTTPDDSGTGNALTLNGGAKKSDMAWIDFGAMELDGVDAYASTGTVPVDTSGSFTVTAWAQAAAIPDGAVALASAEGSAQSAFAVRFVPDATNPEGSPGRWQLSVADTNASSAAITRTDNGEFYSAKEWNHLALVYDGFTKEARLYVNGSLSEISCPDADGDGQADDPACSDLVPWAENALIFKASSLQVGRSGSGSRVGEYFSGLVDDVWAFQGALTEDQVKKLAASWFDVPTQVPGD